MSATGTVSPVPVPGPTNARRFWQLQSFGRHAGRALNYALLAIGSFIFMIPFYWMVTTSIKDIKETYRFPPTFIPQSFTVAAYKAAWDFSPWLVYLQNTLLITVSVLIGTVLSSTLCAYGFARIRFKGRNLLFMGILATMMLPSQVTLIPTYLVFRSFGWLDTLKPLIIPAFFGGGPFFIFLMRQFFTTIPMDLEDAARIDGCGRLLVWWRIMLPLAKPAVTTIAVFTIQGTWNDFFGPLIYLNSPDKFTLALGLAGFRDQAGYVGAVGKGEIGLYTAMMAASSLATIPIIVLFVAAQKYFVEGIQLTGLKG
jgi:multiple sugar transport system permease protein